MANKIQVKRGVEANLPILDVGEPAFTTDSKKTFIGSDSGNVELATKEYIDEQVDTIVSNATVDSEVILARGEETTLGVRLDKQASELSNYSQQVESLNDSIFYQDKKINLSSVFDMDSFFYGNFQKYILPDSAFEVFGVNLMTDGRNFIHDFDITTHKNTSGTTYYFSNSGDNSYDGLSENKPKQKIVTSFMSSLQDGDTIVILDGVYTDFYPAGNILSKSINIVAKNAGKVLWTNTNIRFVYSLTENTTTVYQTVRSAVIGVMYKYKDTYIKLTKKTTLQDVIDNPYSFACISGISYVNLNGDIPNGTNTFLNVDYGACLKIEPTDHNISVYLSGITFIGGNGTLYVGNTANYSVTIYADKCNFYGSAGDAYDAISLNGCDGYFVDCECAYSQKDGFNYHRKNNKDANGLEINCRGYCNGKNGASDNCNGSTQHSGAVMRIGGIYHDNTGPNIADVYRTTKSLNIKCVAFDSNAYREDGYKIDFLVQYDGAEMWCESCVADFGNSRYSFSAERSDTDDLETIMHMNRCKYKTTNTASKGSYLITNV